MFSRTSRILFVAALLLVGAYFLIERPRERAREHSEATNDRLASFDAARIDSIAIERPRDTLAFVRADSVWRMAAPLADIAEPGAIGTILDALNTADVDRRLGAEKDLSPYGLDQPNAVITLASAHRIVLRVAVGKHTVDNAWCYARIDTGDVLLIPTDVHHSSTLPIDAYRDRRVLNFQVRDVTAYVIQTSARSTSWTRRGDRWFALAGRDSVEGDSVAVLSPLHRVRGLRVAAFTTALDTISTLVDSLRVMSVSMGPERRAILRFSRAGTWWRVTDGARLMLVDDDLSDLFARTTDELRDRRLLQFDPSLAVHITCVLPSQSGELVRAGGRWSFPNPAAGRVNPEHAADFVRGLRALKWARPGDEASRAGGHARYYITIAGQRDTIIDELSAGPYDATTSWVTSRSSRGTWLVETARLEELAGRFARLKAR